MISKMHKNERDRESVLKDINYPFLYYILKIFELKKKKFFFFFLLFCEATATF